MFCPSLFQCLHECGVRCPVVGGLAVNLHGIPRMTMDVDLVMAMDPANMDGFIQCARRLQLEPAVPVALEALVDPARRAQWVREKPMIAFPLRAPEASSPTVDVLLDHGLDFGAAHSRATRSSAGGHTRHRRFHRGAACHEISERPVSGRSGRATSAPHPPKGYALNRSGRIRAEGGFDYWVSDAQLDAYVRLTPLQRLEWLE